MKKIILFSIILLGIISCRSTKETRNTNNSDSTNVTEKIVYKDTIITIPGDTIKYQIPCDKDTVFIIRSGKAQSSVIVKDHQVTVTNSCDSLNLVITKIRAEYKQLVQKQSKVSDVQFKETTVYETPKWKNFCTIGFFVLLLWTFRKPIIKLIGLTT